MFSRLIAPVSNEHFWTRVWSQKHLHIVRDEPNYFANILPLEALDQLLQNSHYTTSQIRVVKFNDSIDRDDWSFDRRTIQGSGNTIIPDKLLEKFSQGATLILGAANESIPPLAAFCSPLEKQLGYRIQANIYITPSGSQGFGGHYDSHDVFVLQVHGKKNWRLYEQTVHAPTHDQLKDIAVSANPGPVAHSLTLQPGDTLYIPRGHVHDAVASDTASIHITLGFHPPYFYHLLTEAALQEDAFREALPNPLMPDQQQDDLVAAFQAALGSWIEKLDPATLLDHVRRKRAKEKEFTAAGRFRDLIDLPNITLDTVVQRRPDIIYTLTATDNELQLEFGNKKLTYPSLMASTLQGLGQSSPFPIRALTGFVTDEGKLELVCNLVKQGFLEIVSKGQTGSET